MVARGALPSGGPRVSPLRVSGDVSRHHPVSRGQAYREAETAARSLGIQSPLLDVRTSPNSWEIDLGDGTLKIRGGVPGGVPFRATYEGGTTRSRKTGP